MLFSVICKCDRAVKSTQVIECAPFSFTLGLRKDGEFPELDLFIPVCAPRPLSGSQEQEAGSKHGVWVRSWGG